MSRETEVLRILLELSKEISSQTPMQKVVKKMTTSLRKVLGADECSVMILEESQKELAFSESSGLSKWEIGNIRFKMGEGIAGWVARHKKPVLIEDAASDPRFIQVDQQKRRIYSMICVPLVTKRTLIGTVSMTTRTEGHIFTAEELEVAVLLSAHISLALENNRLYEISVSDGLTNLYNRRYLEQRLSKELAYSRRFHKPLTVLLADIDFFKRLNDTYGHQAGDHALKAVSDIFAASLREYDVVARYGGEEFAILLPSTPRQRGASIAERIRSNIAGNDIRFRNQKIHVTSSIGVASYPEDSDTPEALVHQADIALYAAKSRGRNQVVLYDDSLADKTRPVEPGTPARRASARRPSASSGLEE